MAGGVFSPANTLFHDVEFDAFNGGEDAAPAEDEDGAEEDEDDDAVAVKGVQLEAEANPFPATLDHPVTEEAEEDELGAESCATGAKPNGFTNPGKLSTLVELEVPLE